MWFASLDACGVPLIKYTFFSKVQCIIIHFQLSDETAGTRIGTPNGEKLLFYLPFDSSIIASIYCCIRVSHLSSLIYLRCSDSTAHKCLLHAFIVAFCCVGLRRRRRRHRRPLRDYQH